MGLKDVAGNIMDFLTKMDKEDNSLILNEGGKEINLFEPNVWEVSSEAFDTTHTGGKGAMDIFLEKGQNLGSMVADPGNVLETVSSDKLVALGEDSGQNIEQTIDRFVSSATGEETWLEGKTKSGKDYRFILDSYEDAGEKVYEINGDRFDKDNYNAIIKNITEKLDNVSLAVSKKFEEEGTLSGKEYLSATTQEPKITVGESYSSPRHMMDEVKVTPEAEERKKPWWQ